jgi:hypothetical protein
MAATIMETKETISNIVDDVSLVGFRRRTHTGTWSYINKVSCS